MVVLDDGCILSRPRLDVCVRGKLLPLLNISCDKKAACTSADDLNGIRPKFTGGLGINGLIGFCGTTGRFVATDKWVVEKFGLNCRAPPFVIDGMTRSYFRF